MFARSDQRSIALAIEKHLRAGNGPITALTAQLMADLKLPGSLEDPGEGGGSFDHYTLERGGKAVTCQVHGWSGARIDP